MNEIKELFKEVKDHELLVEKLTSLSLDVECCRQKICLLEGKRKEINEKIKDSSIEEIVTKLKVVRSKIAEIELENMDVITISDLKKLISSSAQRSIVSQKVLLFIEKCIYIQAKDSFSNNVSQTRDAAISKNKALECSGVLEILGKNKINVLILIVDKSVESVLNMIHNTDMYYTVVECIRKMLSEFVQMLDIEALEIFEYSNFLFFCNWHKCVSNLQGTELCRMSSVDFMNKSPRLFGIFQKLVRDKIAAIVQSGIFSYKVLRRIADKYRDTPLSMENPDNWALDVLVKELIKVSKHGDETIQRCGDDVRCYSKAAGDIKRLYYKISENRSSRASRAIEISIKGIQKYINRQAQSKCLEDLLLAFNSTVFIGTEAANTDLLKVCSDLKETIFHNVISMFTINSDTHFLNIQDAKLNIKRSTYEFFEATSKLLDTKRARFFRVTFFDVSFNNFIQWILDHREISSENAYRLATVGEYILSQCTLPPKEITNYHRMKCIVLVLFNNPIERHRKEFLQSLTAEEIVRLSVIIPWNVTLKSFIST